MPFANATKAAQNGITAAIGASLKTSVLRKKKKTVTIQNKKVSTTLINLSKILTENFRLYRLAANPCSETERIAQNFLA